MSKTIRSRTAAASPWADRIEAAWLDRGPLACFLLPLSWIYAGVTSLRRIVYASGLKSPATLPVPVIVVGNLIAGGAGKTPTTLAVVDMLRRNGFTPGIVSRGYARTASETCEVLPSTPAEVVGDEPLLMSRRSGAAVWVGRQRPEAVQALLRRHPEIDVVVSDDGLQHAPLKRDVQVIVFDERGIGNGWLLPAGPLREPLAGSAPAPGSLVVYNAPAPTTRWPGHLARPRLGGLRTLADWWDGGTIDSGAMGRLKQAPSLWAAAGMARPGRFFALLRSAGLRFTELPLPDHHDFAGLPWPVDATAIIVTEKDAVKLRPGRPGTEHVWVATLDFDLGEAFETQLMALVRQAAPRPSRSTTQGKPP